MFIPSSPLEAEQKPRELRSLPRSTTWGCCILLSIPRKFQHPLVWTSFWVVQHTPAGPLVRRTPLLHPEGRCGRLCPPGSQRETFPVGCLTGGKTAARCKKEFGKTAQIIGLPPWLLHDATGYLLKLLQDNEDGHHDSSWKPPKMSWGFYGAPHVEGPAVATSSIPSAALQFANRDPARVRVKMMAKKTLKAPADFARGAVAETGPPLPGSGDEEPGLPDASDNMAETPDLPDAPSVATEELAAEGSELELPDEPSRPPPRVNPGAGAPSCVRGRNGAPAGVYNSEAHEPEAPAMRRPAALKRPAAAPKPAGQKKGLQTSFPVAFPGRSFGCAAANQRSWSQQAPHQRLWVQRVSPQGWLEAQ